MSVIADFSASDSLFETPVVVGFRGHMVKLGRLCIFVVSGVALFLDEICSVFFRLINCVCYCC